MQILRLANDDQTEMIDLLSGAFFIRNGFDFSTPGQGGTFTYEPFGAQWSFGNFQPQTVVLDLGIRGTGAVVIAALDRLQDFLEAIRLSHAGDLAAPFYWLEWSASRENPKRSVLYSGTFKVISQDDITPGLEKCLVLGTLSLTGHPLRENIAQSKISIGGISTVGDKYDYTGVEGNTLARIVRFRIGPHLATVALPLYRVWVGIRRFNQGVANFETIWEAENGTAGTDCGAAVVDATASPEQLGVGTGQRRRVTYATTTLVNRLTITVAQVCAAAGHTDYNHQQGRYLVLLRCKVTAGTSGIQMHYGFQGNQVADEVFVDNTQWRLIPIGNISIPPWEGSTYQYGEYMQNYRIDIYAEELVAGNLDLDCLILIPNEHLLTMDGTGITGVVPNRIEAVVDTSADDIEIGFEWNEATSVIDDVIEFGFFDWYLPPGSGTIVFAAEAVDRHVVFPVETMDWYFDYRPRWTLYRGT